jgi:hypothetical protein
MRQRSLISREGVDASFYIGEVASEESRHVIEEALAVWHGCVSPRTRATAPLLLLAGSIG